MSLFVIHKRGLVLVCCAASANVADERPQVKVHGVDVCLKTVLVEGFGTVRALGLGFGLGEGHFLTFFPSRDIRLQVYMCMFGVIYRRCCGVIRC